MSNSQRVVWGEGMLLTPQHFQQSERYREALQRERGRVQSPLLWGIREFAIEPESLAGGELRVTRCVGILPDGSMFDAPLRAGTRVSQRSDSPGYGARLSPPPRSYTSPGTWSLPDEEAA